MNFSPSAVADPVRQSPTHHVQPHALQPPLPYHQATNAVWIPWNALYIALYEGSKRAAPGLMERWALDLDTGALPATRDSGSGGHQREEGSPAAGGSRAALGDVRQGAELPPVMLGVCSAGGTRACACASGPQGQEVNTKAEPPPYSHAPVLFLMFLISLASFFGACTWLFRPLCASARVQSAAAFHGYPFVVLHHPACSQRQRGGAANTPG